MFNPNELRDAHGRWSLGGLLKHGVEVKPGIGGHRVRFHGNEVGHVGGRNGRYTAHMDGKQITKGRREHSSIAQAAAHVVAAHKEQGPPQLAWKAPPAPTGRAGERKGGGFTAIGITNTALGDAVEQALQEKMGFSDAHPGKRQGPFDVYYDGNAYEVKAVSQSATEYKAKPKKAEVDRKTAAAKTLKLKPHIAIVVYSPKEKAIHVYSKPGVGSCRLTNPQGGWTYHGSVPLDLGNSWDPANVQA